MRLSLLPRDPLKLLHVGGPDQTSDHRDMIDPRRLGFRLVVAEEQLQVRHVLELDVAQRHDTVSEVVLGEFQFLHWCHRLGLVEVQCVGLVDEDLHTLRSVLCRRAEAKRMHLHCLGEGKRQNQLFVTV